MVWCNSWACGAEAAQCGSTPPPPLPNTHTFFLGTTEGLVTHLWQLQPDGLGVVSRAIIEFQARGPILLQWAQQVEPLQVF